MKDWKTYLLWALLVIVLLVGTVALNTKRVGEHVVLSRVEKLEQQMREKTRPVIHADYATIYNSDGEIVIETFGEKEVE